MRVLNTSDLYTEFLRAVFFKNIITSFYDDFRGKKCFFFLFVLIKNHTLQLIITIFIRRFLRLYYYKCVHNLTYDWCDAYPPVLPPPISTSSFCSLCVVAAKHLRDTSSVQRMCSSLLCSVLRSTTNAFSQTTAAAASHLSNTNTTYNICFLIGQHKNNTLLHDCLPNSSVSQ